MAALLGPSWKSRQPRMCQYCQRMFSNKFNLKQVGNVPSARCFFIEIFEVLKLKLFVTTRPSQFNIFFLGSD